MARVVGKFIKGVIGDAVYRQYGETQVIQAKPKANKHVQAKGSTASAAQFGTSSKLGCEIRRSLHLLLAKFSDTQMIGRLNSVVLKAVRAARNVVTDTYDLETDSFSPLDGFEFNIHSKVANILLAKLQVNSAANVYSVQLPELNIPAQLKFFRSISCKLTISCTHFDLKNCYRNTAIAAIDMENKKASFPGAAWAFEAQPGCLCIIAAGLQFFRQGYNGPEPINNKNLNPCAIVKALWVDGEADLSVTNTWATSFITPLVR